ncbi:MAG: hypothetical protein HC942_07735 [Microcoleus sp. SU_5_6]|nr:hypothetical protein [Microcoleus sp. SU_5_6]
MTLFWLGTVCLFKFKLLGRTEEGRRKKEEGRRKKEEGRRKREERKNS